MGLKKYIKGVLQPKEVKKRAKAIRREHAKAKSESTAFGSRTNLDALEKRLGYVFKNRLLLKEALTHPVSIGNSKGKVRSNQRMEFLGDSILQAVMSEVVFKRFDDKEEGELTKTRVALTSGAFLAEMSARLGIPHYLILPRRLDSLRNSHNAAEDSFEAVLGAIFLDGGFEKAKKTLLAWYENRLDELPKIMETQNPKGRLQEIAISRGDEVSYVLLGQSGPDHQKVFEVEVFVGGESMGRGSASSKKSAESAAAKNALEVYNAENLSPKEDASPVREIAKTKTSAKNADTRKSAEPEVSQKASQKNADKNSAKDPAKKSAAKRARKKS